MVLCRFSKRLGADQNFQGCDYFSFWFYGKNDNATWTFSMRTRLFWQGGGFNYTFLDNVSGWRKITVPKGSFSTPSIMNQGWAAIGAVFLYSNNTSNSGRLNFDDLRMGFNNGNALYPSQDSLNFTWDKAAKKLSIEGLFLENQLEESPEVGDVLELYDDDETFWATYQDGSGSRALTISEEITLKQKGLSSLKYSIGSGSYANNTFLHGWATNQDWSTYDFLSFWMYGNNCGKSFAFQIWCPDWANRIYYGITVNWSGWKRIIVPLRNGWVANPNLSTVRRVEFWTNDMTGDLYIDRMVVQKGRWVYVEVGVPDLLQGGALVGGYGGRNNSLASVRLYNWDGSSYNSQNPWASGYSWSAGQDGIAVLSGTSLYNVYNPNCFFVGYNQGKKGETPSGLTKLSSTGTLPSSPNYIGVGGCKKRIAFAIKMPPTDHVASATSGISQCKLKLEIYSV
jgi:hypothetical protein